MHYYINKQQVEVDVLGALSEVPQSGQFAGSPSQTGEASGLFDVDAGGSLSIREREFLESGGLILTPDSDAAEALASASAAEQEPRRPCGHVLIRDQETRQLHVFGQFLVARFANDMKETEIDHLLDANNLRRTKELCFAPNLFELRTNSESDIACFKAGELQDTLGDKLVYAEPVSACSFDQRVAPNDKFYRAQWQWNNRGLVPNTVAGADVGAEGAWDLSTGEGMLIAVVDRGFHVKNPDIAANIDYDSSGFLYAESEFSRKMEYMPTNSHGTFCAAQAAAEANNGLGTCGIAPDAKLMLLGLDSRHGVSQYEMALAIAYAVSPRRAMGNGYPERGADVLTCAEGPENGIARLESVLRDALDYAYMEGRGGNDRGMPVFWAVANKHLPVNEDEIVSYETVIAVGSSTIRDRRAYDCAYGDGLAFLAPGANVFNACGSAHDYDYRPASGTSFAAPTAAGIAALMLSKRPELSAADVRTLMEQKCRKVDAMAEGVSRDELHGFGVVSAKGSVEAAIGL